MEKNNKKTFRSFLEELQTIYREARADYDTVHDTMDIARKDYEATMADPNAPEHIKVIARGDFERAKLTFQHDRKAIQESYADRTGELRQQLETFTENLYRATPDRIDQKAMQLLDLGILSPTEMEHLAYGYRDNPPMMRVIAEYAKKAADGCRRATPDKARDYNVLHVNLRSVNDSSRAMAGFDEMMKYGSGGIGDEPIMAKVHAKHWDRLYADACEIYDNFIVQPSGGAEE